ncbi:MAG: hypothetical protein OHK0012_23990 [Synechococcales cyanobacterium]
MIFSQPGRYRWIWLSGYPNGALPNGVLNAMHGDAPMDSLFPYYLSLYRNRRVSELEYWSWANGHNTVVARF